MASGWLPNVQPQQPIASTWGNTIRDRTVTVFDTTAQRDSQLPAPTAGMVCYVLADKHTYQHDGVGWHLRPGEIYATAVSTADGSSASTTLVQLPGTAIAFTLATPRTLRFEIMNARIRVSGANGQAQVTARLDAAGANVSAAVLRTVNGVAAAAGDQILSSANLTPVPAGAHTADLAVSSLVGATICYSLSGTRLAIFDAGP